MTTYCSGITSSLSGTGVLFACLLTEENSSFLKSSALPTFTKSLPWAEDQGNLRLEAEEFRRLHANAFISLIFRIGSAVNPSKSSVSPSAFAVVRQITRNAASIEEIPRKL